MNVLISSAGRRGSLVKSFGRAIHARGGRVFASDMSPLAPALYLADEALPALPLKQAGYLDNLLDLVHKNQIGLIVPTLDSELALLAEAKAAFAERGCIALISDPPFVALSGNKWVTYEFCQTAGIETHRSWLPSQGYKPEELPDKLFVKPCEGSASAHTYSTNRVGLEATLFRVPDPIIQEEADGHEVTIDALLDLNGDLIHYVPRRRIRHLAGESIIGVTYDNPELENWLERVLKICGDHGARGPITLQCFLSPRGPLLTEINPRFGGGFPLTDEAGGHYPEWCVAMAMGESVAPRIGEFRRGLYMTRYYSEIFFEEPLWQS